MNPFSRLTPDICIRWIIATAKVAVLFGLLLFLLSFCSCSSSRPVMTETAATESITSLETANDSVGSSLEIQTSASGYLDISDLQIIFYPPVITPPDSLPDLSALRPSLSANPHPAAITIGHITAGKTNEANLHETKDSVVSHSLDSTRVESHNESIQHSRSRDPTSCRWPVLLVLGFALVMIVFTGYKLYRAENP